MPPAEALTRAGFSSKNTEEIRKEIAVPFSREQAEAKQRFCNVCHTGCLDCHYAPDREKGVHHFQNRPRSETCGGYGRGTSICHPGAMQSRRGETYIGGDYSIPTGMEPDVHYKKDIHCADCHSTGVRGMGDMQRKAHCQDCHIEIEEAHAASIHRNLDCSACHINELRGYQVVIWGPGEVAGKANPFKKFSLYYGIQKPPILMKDQKGRWMAVKVFPHSVGNMASDVGPSGKVQFRWPGGETRDPYYIVGTFSAPSNNKHLLWLEIQQASHPYGKGRSCGSCHGDRQVTTSRWEYMDDQGAAAPFAGGYRIVADKDGLRVVDLRSTSEIKPAPGYKPEDFAAWLYFRDKWSMPGDFSISTEKEKYARYLSLSKKMEGELREMEKRVGKDDKRAQKRFKELRGVVLHNEDKAPDAIGSFRERAGR